ncbi:MAG: hypothetical protein WBP16_03390 [Ferruginibacter sp.]
MNKRLVKYVCAIASMLFVGCLFAGCAASNKGSVSKDEKLNMNIKEKRDVVNFSALKDQPTESLAMRGSSSARGMSVTPVVGAVVSLASNAIKKVIANEKKKYTADYQFALTDLYFYDQLSNESPFDPVGMQFNGFKIIRTFTNSSGHTDTAFTAGFLLDKTNPYEILNNSLFRLKLDDINLKYAKAKVPAGGKKELNMDIEIGFYSSYLNKDAVLFDNVCLGKFYLFLRNAPLDSTADNYTAYYEQLKGSSLTGKSFIVPRSFGYHIEEAVPVQGYSQGAYTIIVKVKESTKNVFVNKLISENTDIIIDAYKDKTLKFINKKLPTSLQ